MSGHWTHDPQTGEPRCSCADFHCPYAPRGAKRCPASICDCFIDTYPDSPFGLHPEAFVVSDPHDHRGDATAIGDSTGWGGPVGGGGRG